MSNAAMNNRVMGVAPNDDHRVANPIAPPSANYRRLPVKPQVRRQSVPKVAKGAVREMPKGVNRAAVVAAAAAEVAIVAKRVIAANVPKA